MFSGTDLEEILGWNDGTRVGIKSHALSSPSVQPHEAIHGRIFNETADGHLHRVCCMSAGTAIDRRHGSIYTQAAKIMFEDTRLAHEAGATYLAIQALPTRDLRFAERNKLSNTYKDYYSLLEELAGPISPTTWLRFAFAWTFIHWCFHSRRFELFFETKEPSLLPFLDVPSPTERFIKAKAYLMEDARIQEWTRSSLEAASLSFSQNGFDLWDFHSESAWDARAGRLEIQAFENQLTAVAGDWLCDHLPFENADFRRPKSSFGPGFDYVMQELRLLPQPLFCGSESVLNEDFRKADEERLARAHSADIVEHRPSCPLVDLTSSSFAEAMGECLIAIAASTHVIILGHSDEEKIILLCRHATEPVEEGMFKYEAVGSFLIDVELAPLLVQGKLAPRLDGVQKPELWVMLRASRDNLFDVFMRGLQICADPSPPLDEQVGPKLLVRGERLQFYFDGPWADVYEMPGVRVTSRKVSLLDDPDASSPKLLSVRIAAPPHALVGLLISAKPAWAGLHLDRYEQRQFASDALTELQLNDNESSLLMTPFMSAWHIWDCF